MKGLGIDIIEIERIKKAIKKRANFKKRFFTEIEIEYCEEYKIPWSHYAGRFAAKEAVVKALGTGFREFKWQDIEIINDNLGKPEVNLYNQAQKIAHKKGIEEIMLSISHSRDYAVAQAIAL
ncbi:holo-(acyl-carrier-protein) synthase [Halobacteroides halobius DSM 5150]|uniref:Holo-[acyl-carrier-protein] synthase n=1 Tax=Halobacteroides halobius (strain ATCC 35273 / DSM 5150 / MD-1) TaxID=748449 RepID=L0K5M9_HALHC|nr:holo-ACP synthase [Halobacteroides halobius]AGB40296.1 holo-(acyl-carrier-protein) synthase [Halobacteroides halobius DSM 5150]